MKILFYRLTHSPWLLIFLLNCILQPLTLFQFSFPRGSIPIHTVSSHSQRKQGQVLSTLFSYDGGGQTFNYGQTVANQPNYLILIPPNTKSILTNSIIITAQYVYFHSQNFSVISCLGIGRCTRPMSKKMQVLQN